MAGGAGARQVAELSERGHRADPAGPDATLRVLASTLRATGNHLVFNMRASKEHRMNRSGRGQMQEEPGDGSMTIQAGGTFHGVDWGVRERRSEGWELRMEMEELQGRILGEERGEFRLALWRLPMLSSHIPALLDSSDQGHRYSVRRFPARSARPGARELCSVTHTSWPQHSLLSSPLYSSNSRASGGHLVWASPCPQPPLGSPHFLTTTSV